MVRTGAWLLVCLLATGCDDNEGGSDFDTSSTPTTKKENGFSAGLAKELKGSDDKGDGKDTKAGDSKAGDTKTGDDKAGDTKAGDTKTGDDKAGDDKASDTKAGDDKASDTKASDTKAGDTKAPDAKVTNHDSSPGTDKVAASPAIDPAAPRVRVKPPANIAAIKLTLEPNWDRDVGEAATISLVVKVPGSTDKRVFSFRYGYEDKSAPKDREAYKKWLGENKVLTVKLDRQRGGAWYLEGHDATGASAFRMIVTYGGHKLFCGGSLYRDPASNKLGDIRDSVVGQAKKICETIAL